MRTRRPTTAGACRFTCCPSSAGTGWTRSIVARVCASRKSSCASPRSCDVPSPRAPICATAAGAGSRHSGWRRSRSSSRRSGAFSTRRSRTSTSNATRRGAAACASRLPSPRGRSSRWTSSWRSSMPPASRTAPCAALDASSRPVGRHAREGRPSPYAGHAVQGHRRGAAARRRPRSATTWSGSASSRRARIRVVARSAGRSPAAASVRASCAICASARCAFTILRARASGSPMPRPRPAYARCR